MINGRRASSTCAGGWDLLAIPAVRRLVRWRGFPKVFQLAVLAAFIALAVLGWGLYPPPGVNAKLYAKSNLVNLLLWGLWWPAMIWVTVLLGRAWCVVCPLELVASLSESAGRRLGLPQLRLNARLAAGGLAVGLFVVLQLLVPGIQLHRTPAYTSFFLWAMLGLALLTGLFLKDRAFCRGFCPVSPLLSAYGRHGALAMRHAANGSCPACARGSVATESETGNAAATHCPSLLNPAKLDSGKDCLVCGQCVKAGHEMQLRLRAPFAAADARAPVASWPLTLAVMVVSGFVTYELCGVWKAAEPVFLWAPDKLKALLDAGAWGGWIQGLWTVVVVPLLLWLALGAVTLALGGARNLGEAWRRLALPMVLVVVAGHAAKGLEKFTSWAGFLPYALSEPTGVQTALKINAQTMAQPAAWLSLPVLSALAMLLVGLALLLAVREARLADPEKYRRRIAPLVALAGFYFFLVFGWGGWAK